MIVLGMGADLLHSRICSLHCMTLTAHVMPLAPSHDGWIMKGTRKA